MAFLEVMEICCLDLYSRKNSSFSCKECSELTASWCSNLQDRPPFSSQGHILPCSLYRWLSLDQFQVTPCFLSPLLSRTLYPRSPVTNPSQNSCTSTSFLSFASRGPTDTVEKMSWGKYLVHRIQIDIHTHMHTLSTTHTGIHYSYFCVKIFK